MKTCRYKKNPQVARRKLEDVLLVVTTQDTTLHQLNETAAFLYESLEAKALSREDMAVLLCEEYEVEKAKAEKDVEGFVALMVGKGILLEEG